LKALVFLKCLNTFVNDCGLFLVNGYPAFGIKQLKKNKQVVCVRKNTLYCFQKSFFVPEISKFLNMQISQVMTFGVLFLYLLMVPMRFIQQAYK